MCGCKAFIFLKSFLYSFLVLNSMHDAQFPPFTEIWKKKCLNDFLNNESHKNDLVSFLMRSMCVREAHNQMWNRNQYR